MKLKLLIFPAYLSLILLISSFAKIPAAYSGGGGCPLCYETGYRCTPIPNCAVCNGSIIDPRYRHCCNQLYSCANNEQCCGTSCCDASTCRYCDTSEWGDFHCVQQVCPPEYCEECNWLDTCKSTCAGGELCCNGECYTPDGHTRCCDNKGRYNSNTEYCCERGDGTTCNYKNCMQCDSDSPGCHSICKTENCRVCNGNGACTSTCGTGETCCNGECYNPDANESCCDHKTKYNTDTQECCGGQVITKCNPAECKSCDSSSGSCEVCGGDTTKECHEGVCCKHSCSNSFNCEYYNEDTGECEACLSKVATYAQLNGCSKVDDPLTAPVPNGCSSPLGNNPAGCGEYTDFLNSCNAHDTCYQSCNTGGYSSKTICDGDFYGAMQSVCDYAPAGECQDKCNYYALEYYSWVLGYFGDEAYKADQVAACACNDCD